jgi:hypothetical protein
VFCLGIECSSVLICIRNKSINVEFNPHSFKSSSFGNASPSLHVTRFQFYVFAIYVAIFPRITRAACTDDSLLFLTIASSRDHLEYDEWL